MVPPRLAAQPQQRGAARMLGLPQLDGELMGELAEPNGRLPGRQSHLHARRASSERRGLRDLH